jgi:hypothetical protein
MKGRIGVVLAVAAMAFAIGAVAPSSQGVALSPSAYAKPCGSGYVHAVLPWGHKCLRQGQFCKVSGDRYYHRYGFHCHTGARLSRRATQNNPSGSGCQPGYSPCLPRVADLNCSDIPDSKKPIHVTGSDPYRLDGDGDGIACEP